MHLPIWGMFRQLLSLNAEEEQLNDVLNFNNWGQLKKRYVSISASNLIEAHGWMSLLISMNDLLKRNSVRGEKRRQNKRKEILNCCIYICPIIYYLYRWNSLTFCIMPWIQCCIEILIFWDLNVILTSEKPFHTWGNFCWFYHGWAPLSVQMTNENIRYRAMHTIPYFVNL